MNRAGYRDVEHAKAKPKGVHRAVFVGDSFTYGVGVLLDDTYPERTARTLSRARGETWEPIVLAQPGLDSQEEEAVIEHEAFGYEPDLVVLGYVLNDAEDPDSAERRRAAEWEAAGQREPRFWRRSAFLRLVDDRLRATLENRRRIENHLALYRDGAPGFRASLKSIQAMAALCREKGVSFVVVLFPLFANPLDATYPFASIHRKLAASLGAAGINLLDLLPYYEGMDWRLLVVEGERDEHPNEIAHRIAGQALFRALESVLPPPGSRSQGS